MDLKRFINEEMLSGLRRMSCMCLALFCVLIQAKAQQSVGLVLSGGGAKGIAHIGVIQALEDNDIPIDYVAGTSMGAIVGALYAMGYTPEEMMQLIESKGFSNWSTGVIDPSLEYNYAKSDPTPRLATFNINLGDSTKTTSILPASLINPLPMNFAFMELFSAYSAQCGDDFNNLFVPFRCVTSDVYNKHKVVCSSGSLGDAVRASMSFPLVFHPIEIDGVLMYDGGIYDNFPVDVMREDFAPDIMIGSDVSSPDSKPQANNIIGQLEDMIIQNNDYDLPADEGIRLHIDVQQFSLLDFPACRQIYKVGYDYAMSMMDSIKTRVTSRVPHEARQLRRSVFKSKTPYVEFDSVNVSGGTRSQDAYIKYLFTKGRTDTFGLAQARDAYYRAISSGKLQNLVPQAVLNRNGDSFTLDVKADVKNNFNVGIGGYITSSNNSMLFVSSGYNTLSFNSFDFDINGWIGQSYMAAALNMKMSLRSWIPSYLKLQAVISRQKMYENDRAFYDDGSTLVSASEAFARLKYGMACGRSGKFEAALGIGRLSSRFYGNMAESSGERDRSTDVIAQARLHFERSTLNSDNYPVSGSRYRAIVMGLYGNNNFYPANDEQLHMRSGSKGWGRLELNAEKYWAVGKSFNVGVESHFEASTRKLLDDYMSTMVGLPVFRPTASTYNVFGAGLRAPEFITLGVVPVWRIGGMMQLRGQFHGFLPGRRVVPVTSRDDSSSIPLVCRPRYTKWLGSLEFFGEVAAVYSLPFADLTAYVNYSSAPGYKWSYGISFGLFFLAPQFLK